MWWKNGWMQWEMKRCEEQTKERDGQI
jgi:hypothetical protein